MSQSATGAFDALFHETRKFPPSTELTAHGNVSDPAIYEQARHDPEAFWDARAREQIDWFHPWNQILDWKPPFAKWFIGGTLN
ncbi:MAG: acetyl-coenzyme A synthetase, partial [Proteobacteria bacterium]|nr:acetyl-coenzyme A synthetase [Pseudomonadota bacterium]